MGRVKKEGVMAFLSFVYLVGISVVVTLALRHLPKLKIKLPGGIVSTIIVGYIGARLGAFFFGDWPFLTFQGVSILPGALGAIAIILLARVCAEYCKK